MRAASIEPTGKASLKMSASGYHGFALRCMFALITAGQDPRYICHDNDPLFQSWWWQSLVGSLFFCDEKRELWSVPYTPVSNPYVERLIGTVRREFLDQVLFWNG